MERKEKNSKKFQYTDDEIDTVLLNLQEHREYKRQLLDSAQAGNSDDLKFLFEIKLRRGITLYVSSDDP